MDKLHENDHKLQSCYKWQLNKASWAASQSFCLEGFYARIPPAHKCIFTFNVCVHVYITMYICLAGCHEVCVPSADIVTLALWEQMEEQ